MIKVKICGITTREDAITALEAGVDALGFVFFQGSPRAVSPDHAAAIIAGLPPFVQTVGLFVNEAPDIINTIADQCGLDIVQLHGDETPEICTRIRRRVIKAFRVKDETSIAELERFPVAGYLLDAWTPAAHGGTGQTFNWEIAASAATSHRIILAGGLTPDNVAEAVRQVQPYAVDVSSGVESAPGKKDAGTVREFIRIAKETAP
jgi:phosphoribosylanthranilate isomerase